MRKRLKIVGLVAAVLAVCLPFVRLESQVVAQGPGSFKPLDIILVVDQSKSMFNYSDPKGTPCVDADGRILRGDDGRPQICDPDYPQSMRQTAARYFIDYLSVEPRGQPRVGVVYFGQDAALVVPLFDVTDRSARQSAIELLQAVPEDRWWTNTNEALDLAYEQLSAAPRAGRQPVVVFLSDGHPELAHPWPVEDTADVVGKRNYYARHQELVDQFEALGCPVFTVVIALTDWVDETDPFLQEVLGLESFKNVWQQSAVETNGAYYRVTEQYDPKLRRAELMDIYHSILARLLGVSPITTIGGPLPAGEERSVPIPVGQCQSLVVEVNKPGPETEVTLMGPGGQTVEAEVQRQEYELFKIEQPEAGDWQLKMAGGEGTYYIRLDCGDTELACTLVKPAASHPQCKEMRIAGELRTDAGEPVTDGRMDVEITLPDGSATNLPLRHEDEGTYAGLFADTQQLGEYKLGLVGQDRAREKPLAKFEKIVSVVQGHYIDFVEPLPGGKPPGGDLVVRAALKVGCDPVVDPMLSGRDTQITAALLDTRGNQVGSVRLRDDGREPDETSVDGIFGGIILGVEQGDYTLNIEFANDTRDVSDKISTQISVGPPLPTATPEPTATPTVVPTPTPTPTPGRPKVGLVKTDLGKVRAGQVLRIPLEVDGTALEQEQAISVDVVLDGVPSALAQTEVNAQPGRVNTEEVSAPIPEDLAPEQKGGTKSYDGNVLLAFPDGETSKLTFGVTVLPPPIPSWIYVVVVLVVLALVGGGIALYVGMTGKGRLTGTIIYVAQPPGTGSFLDEDLRGSKWTIVLDEQVPLAETPAPAPQQAADPFAWQEAAADTPAAQGDLHTELTFTARRRQTEARVSVARTNGQVLLNEIPILVGASPHLLQDGDTIQVGSFILQYEGPLPDPRPEDQESESDWGNDDW